jgi:CDP-Glycerol:Poly(glycerophosphate) glycerophosphotransferase
VGVVAGKLQSGAVAIVLSSLAGLAFVTLTLTPWRVVGYAMAALVLLAVAWRGGAAAELISGNLAQIAVAAGFLSRYRLDEPHATVPLAITGVLVVALLVGVPVLGSKVNARRVDASNLLGYSPDRQASRRVADLQAGVLILIAVTGVFAIAAWSLWPLVALSAALNLAAGLVWSKARRTGVDASDVRSALERFDAAFALYFSAPDNTEYHVEMWAPYLERIGRRWLIITREPNSFKLLTESMGPVVPVVFCPQPDDLHTAITPGLNAVFYVNNGALNADMVRHHRLTHIQLLHGDSDKASSYNPVTAIFDRIFVAGQAGIDRYADNGVHIPHSKFDIVGRPQIETIEVAKARISAIEDKVVLYASTWVGAFSDTNYSSLSIGETILTNLLARDVTVILRPHPYANRHLITARYLSRLERMLAADRAKTGRRHIFGTAATTEMSFVDCINAADALISDVSGVLSDALYSNKPLAVTNMIAALPSAFEEAFPLAKAAYVINGVASNIDQVLDDLLGDDPREEARRKARIHFLGDFDYSNYADAFVSKARSYTFAEPALEEQPVD